MKVQAVKNEISRFVEMLDAMQSIVDRAATQNETSATDEEASAILSKMVHDIDFWQVSMANRIDTVNFFIPAN